MVTGAAASFEESTELLRSRGTEDAVNLEGDIIVSMTLDDDLVDQPSDPSAEHFLGMPSCSPSR